MFVTIVLIEFSVLIEFPSAGTLGMESVRFGLEIAALLVLAIGVAGLSFFVNSDYEGQAGTSADAFFVAAAGVGRPEKNGGATIRLPRPRS